MTDTPLTLPWARMEPALAKLPVRQIAWLAHRAASRLAPVILEATEAYGPEAEEWLHACLSVLQVVDRFCLNQPVSRLTLDLVAEIARGTANSAANVVRMLGPSPAAENAELAFAATAFAADAARVGASARSASFALKGLRIGEAAGRIPETEWQQDWHAVQSGTTATAALWLGPAPEWYTVGLSRYHAIKNQFPRWLVWE